MNFVSFIKSVKLYEKNEVEGVQYTINLSDFVKKDKDINKTIENVLSYFVGAIVELNDKIEKLTMNKSVDKQSDKSVDKSVDKSSNTIERLDEINYSFSAYVPSQNPIKTKKCVVMIVKNNILSIIKSDSIGKIIRKENQINIIYDEKIMYDVIPSFFSLDGKQMTTCDIMKNSEDATLKIPCDNVIIVLDFVN